MSQCGDGNVTKLDDSRLQEGIVAEDRRKGENGKSCLVVEASGRKVLRGGREEKSWLTAHQARCCGFQSCGHSFQRMAS